MNRFLQIHILTFYPPSNPNRDDLGQPKTATVGGKLRQRISSQAIKRAVRTSPAFAAALEGAMGQRTQRLGEEILKELIEGGVAEDKAREATRAIVAVFGKLDGDTVRTKQLAFVSPSERRTALELAKAVLGGKEPPKEKDLAKIVLQKADGAVDIAMFGRMLADNAEFNREAAVQVAHAFTTNAVEIDDDYYTAVDDLKKPEEDAGAGFVGEAGFGSGVYYLYVCVNRDLLLGNLDGDRTLAARGLEALMRALAHATPTGKINSYAHHPLPEFILVEKGDQQPRSLATAFAAPVRGPDLMAQSIAELLKRRKAFAKVYGDGWADDRTLHVGEEASATLRDLVAFVVADVENA